MNLVDRAKNLLLSPKDEWPVIEKETMAISDLYKAYVMPLAAIGPVASFIGFSMIGMQVPFMGTIRIPIGSALSHAIVTFALTLGGVYVLGLIIDFLAPSFAGTKNFDQAFKVAVYASTASWVGGVFALLPALSILALLFSLYSLYLLYLGLPVLMKSPPDKSLGYTAAVIIAAVVVFVVIGTISMAVLPTPTTVTTG